LAMWEVVDAIALIWTATILAYGAIAGALVLARWALDQIRIVRNSLEQQPSRNENYTRCRARIGTYPGYDAVDQMTQDLLIGIVALIAAASLFMVGLPTRHGESPRFLQFYAAPMVYPAIVLIFLALGIAEVITWAVTMKW
jgi:hypothetical protein